MCVRLVIPLHGDQLFGAGGLLLVGRRQLRHALLHASQTRSEPHGVHAGGRFGPLDVRLQHEPMLAVVPVAAGAAGPSERVGASAMSGVRLNQLHKVWAVETKSA